MSTLSAVRREHSERAFSKVGVNFLDARDVRLTAILIKQLGTTKKEYTKSAQSIRESAERIARQFHHRQVSDDIFVLAMILDCDGAKEIRKRGIDPLEAYKAAMEPLRMLPAPLPAEASSHRSGVRYGRENPRTRAGACGNTGGGHAHRGRGGPAARRVEGGARFQAPLSGIDAARSRRRQEATQSDQRRQTARSKHTTGEHRIGGSRTTVLTGVLVAAASL